MIDVSTREQLVRVELLNDKGLWQAPIRSRQLPIHCLRPFSTSLPATRGVDVDVMG